tara:strand:- start:83 stop:1066 length:984 start_codon:yes stop_codon:yes gene_type:complete
MEPLPIAVMHIDTYNIEESPLHQIVKKLIYKKILDLEPYNFNYIYGGSNGLGEKIYGNFSNTYDAAKKYSYYNESRRKEIRENMKWGDVETNTIIEYIHNHRNDKDQEYNYTSFGQGKRADTYIPLKPYKDKIFMEYSFYLDSLKIIPDITLMDDNGKPETVIEILYTSLPKAEKLIKYIESNLNVIFVFADKAIVNLSTDMACRREFFKIPIHEAWMVTTSRQEKISRAVNILLQKKLKDDEYITSKTICKNIHYNPYNKWKKNYLNLGLRFKTNKEEKERDISHDMIKMKETSNLIILLRYMQKHTQENLRPAQIPVFEGQHNER